MKACLITGVFIWVVSAIAMPAAERTLHLPDTPYTYAYLDLPSHFNDAAAQKFDNTPADNPVTDAGATLGRVLFYDTQFVGQQHRVLRLVPRAVARVRRSEIGSARGSKVA
jgi:hypothetical protein